MAIEANPIIQTIQTSLQSNPSVTTQAAMQGTPEFQKQQRLLNQNTAAANQTGNAAQTTQTGHAAQAFINHGSTAQLRNNARREGVEQRPEYTTEVESTSSQSASSAGPVEVQITQQDLENSFVNLLRENNYQLQGNHEGARDSQNGSEAFTMNYLHNNYSTRIVNGSQDYGSMVLLEKNNGVYNDTLGIFGDYIYAQKPEISPVMYFS